MAVYMHIVIYNYFYMVVFCGLLGAQDKDDSARRIWLDLGYYFSHMGNERACALHPQE